MAALLVLGGLAAAALLAPASRKDDRQRRRSGDAVRKAVAFAALMLCVAWGGRLAAALGFPDGDLPRRLAMAVLGTFLVAIGNDVPKTLTPLAALRCDPAAVQALQRFAGWTWVLTGIVFAVGWLTLPVTAAERVTVTAIGAGVLLVGTRGFLLRRARHGPA